MPSHKGSGPAHPEQSSSVLLDRAATAREVAVLTALCLLASPNVEAALTMLAYFGEQHPPEQEGELDACSIAAQAIREAVEMRGGADGQAV